ncbi:MULTISPECIES: ATP-binding response regulator [Actibacterium]|uniref:ATP-binding response regulator n=1 Tax=Actibacterium TaxID=1433986 RepID=UPI0009EBAF5F
MVSIPAHSPGPMLRIAAALSARRVRMMLAALACLAGAFVSRDSAPGGVLAAAGLSLATLVALAWILPRFGPRPPDLRALAAFSENDPVPAFATDGDGAVIYRNPAAGTRFGAGRHETLVRAMGELFANTASVIHRLQSRADAQGAAREDVVTRRGHVRVSVHSAQSGTFFWRFDEMQERGTTRAAEGLSLPLMTVGRNGTVLFMNEALRRVLGTRARSVDEVFATPPAHPGDLARLRGADGPVDARCVEIEGQNGRKEVYLLPSGTVAPAAEFDGEAFDALPVALLRLSRDGTVRMANRLARDLLGQPGGPINLSDLVEGLGRSVLDWLASVPEGPAAHRSEVLRVRRSAEDVFLQITLAPAEPGQDGLVAVLHDATELKTLEAQFVQSQKMQAIGQLAGGVAHDFNNLLTAITGHCDLLLLRHDQGDPDYNDLMQINQNANRAGSLVGQLLAFSRKQTLRPEVLDLSDTLTDLSHLLNRLVGERVSLTVSHDPALAPIRADKRQLEQVIMNLVVNARDAMPTGGEIRIETALHHMKQELRRDRAVVPPGDYVLIRVVDEGQGIPADKLSKIFEPFFTTKRVGEGTGLGLSTAYGIVKQSGGFIFVDSVPGSGSCFTIYLPVLGPVLPDARAGDRADLLPALPKVAAAEPCPDDKGPRAAGDGLADLVSGAARNGAAPKTAAEAAPRPGEGVVLLVEDEAPVRAFASRALRMRGYTVLEAASAEEALQTLSDDAIRVDVFVTDVVMPGMDGPSWVRRALEDRPDTRVVFVSGYAEDAFSDTQPRIPNSVFLPKPFSLAELTMTVRDQLH